MNIAPDLIDGLRPAMPGNDEARSLHQRTRHQLLDEDWEPVLIDWLAERVAEERLATWGAPDTAVNTLADIARQLTTPGLYGARPDVRHADPLTVPLVGPAGEMDRGGIWTAMQQVQYFCAGVGDYLVHASGSEEGLSYRLVNPGDVWVDPDPEQPDLPNRIWWLRLRQAPSSGRWFYAWDQWDSGRPTVSLPDPREPSRRIVAASGTQTGNDVSNWYRLPVGGESGDGYAFRWRDGTPFMPFVTYRSVDAKRTWNHHHRRGAVRGALNAAQYWTYAGHCAKDASGKTVIVAGLQPIVQKVQGIGDGPAVLSVQMSPGSLMYHKVDGDGAQPFVQEIGPGTELSQVVAFARVYEALELRRWGIEGDDAVRDSADPKSGAALYISRQNKREYASMVRPLFERADLDLIAMSAALCRIYDLGDYPERGYSISYAEIPESPAEREERRRQAEWEESRGMISPLDLYQRLNPGTTKDDAVAAYTRVAEERARLTASINAHLTAKGLPPVAPAAQESA